MLQVVPSTVDMLHLAIPLRDHATVDNMFPVDTHAIIDPHLFWIRGIL